MTLPESPTEFVLKFALGTLGALVAIFGFYLLGHVPLLLDIGTRVPSNPAESILGGFLIFALIVSCSCVIYALGAGLALAARGSRGGGP